jgi:4a-hydroxytetrahydrobiopterin dehydratase
MDRSSWKITEKGLHRTLSFASFSELGRFVAELGPEADAMDHHPDLEVKRAVQLSVYLITHDVKRITEKDSILAGKIDRLYENY